MELDDILPGCKLDIIEPRLDAEGKAVGIIQSYKSSLYSVLDSNHIEVMTPQKSTTIVPLENGSRYKLIFTTSQGLLRADGDVVDRYKKENFYLTEFEVIGDISKYQRREFFRIDCMLPVTFASLSDAAGDYFTINQAKQELDKKNETGEPVQYGSGTAIDISGGGMRFTTSCNLQEDSYIMMKFELYMKSGNRMMEIIGRVIHSDHIPDTDKYSHRIKFVFTDGVSQEVVIRYIFEIERSRRRKEQGL